MTSKEAFEKLWQAKCNRRECFLYATTTRPVIAWEYKSSVEIPAGTRVLVTHASRFGDVGIRAHNIVPPSMGCDARVNPDELIEWSETY